MLVERRIALVTLVAWTMIRNCDPVIISKPECGHAFECPDHCTVHWEGACPSECKCGSRPDKCEDVVCPADPPHCIVYTNHLGCQDCACIETHRRVRITGRPTTTTTTATTTAPDPTSTLTPPPRDGADPDSESDDKVPALISEPGHPPQSPAGSSDEELRCGRAQRDEIERHFGALDAEAAEIGRLSASSLLFPPVFAFTRFELRKRCAAYNAAYARTSFAAKRNCFNDFDVYIRTYYAYSYACGFGTEAFFYRFFDCLQSLRFSKKMMACQYEHKPVNLADRRGVCDTYNDLMKCVQRPVVRQCGWDGWAVFYQYLAVNSKSFSRSCRLNKVGGREDEDKISLTTDPDAEA